MIRLSLYLAAMVGFCFVGDSALPAQVVPAPFTMAKQYSSDTTVSLKDGMTIKGKTFVDGDKLRSEMEMNGMKMATIVRKDKLKMYQVMIDQKMVMQMDYDESKFKGKTAAAFGPEGKFELIGPDTVDGVAATKYKVTSDKSHQVFFFWLDLAKKAPVKMESEDKSFSAVWKNYKEGPQSADLFEIPAGFQVMDMPEMPKANGAGAGEGGGMSQ